MSLADASEAYGVSHLVGEIQRCQSDPEVKSVIESWRNCDNPELNIQDGCSVQQFE